MASDVTQEVEEAGKELALFTAKTIALLIEQMRGAFASELEKNR